MAFRLQHPIERTFVLDEIDPTGEAKVTFKQATTRETQLRDQLVFGGQSRSLVGDGLRIENSMQWSVREMIEARLTMTGCEGILDEDGRPLFHFKNGACDMSVDAFNAAWGKLPPAVAKILHEKCLDANPDWDFRVNPTPTSPVSPPMDGEAQ